MNAATQQLLQPYYFFGGDTAPGQSVKADYSSSVVIRATLKEHLIPALAASSGGPGAIFGDVSEDRVIGGHPQDWRVALLYARKYKQLTIRQWSGEIHRLHRNFGFSMVMKDPGGGGLLAVKELGQSRQLVENREVDLRPLTTPDDPTASPLGQPIVRVFRATTMRPVWGEMPADGGAILYDNAHSSLREAVDGTHSADSRILFPPGAGEILHDRNATAGSQWPAERVEVAQCVQETLEQLKAVSYATAPDGAALLTKSRARQFDARGKKDLAYGLLYAWCGFLLWCAEAQADGSFDGVAGRGKSAARMGGVW